MHCFPNRWRIASRCFIKMTFLCNSTTCISEDLACRVHGDKEVLAVWSIGWQRASLGWDEKNKMGHVRNKIQKPLDNLLRVSKLYFVSHNYFGLTVNAIMPASNWVCPSIVLLTRDINLTDWGVIDKNMATITLVSKFVPNGHHINRVPSGKWAQAMGGAVFRGKALDDCKAQKTMWETLWSVSLNYL